jgi:tRNA (mo5U34)-methyltransferase
VTDELPQQIAALAPWHMKVALTADLNTVDGNRDPRSGTSHRISVINPAELRPLLRRLYPGGLGGKRFLDCACNAGGYSLVASDLGAKCFGFDVRDHWIEQARFLQQHFGKSDDQVTFEVCDLLEVGERLGRERFDICLFKGIFYHLPDPVAGLKIVADLTDEVLILDTAVTCGLDDGFLKIATEGVANPLSGVHHLAWHPTGPEVLARILEWLGFETTCVVFWRQHPPSEQKLGRVRIVGARNPALLADMLKPPAASIVLPRAGDVLSRTATLSAEFADSVVEASQLEFRLAGRDGGRTVLGAATRTFGGWTYQWDTTSVRNGEYTLSSLVYDLAGRPGLETGVTITVRN